MQRDIVVKGRGLGGSSDLTLLAPIKPGFIESLESVTYKTRIKRVLETLHGAREIAHEHHTARLLSDSVERVGAIHSVRVAVLEPEDKVLLAVTFDGSWESYIRVLWDKVGTLLDLIFCGTVDYVTAYDHTFEEWLAWARRVQVETGFFYGPADSTARDVLYQRRIERMRVRGAGDELNELRAVLPSAEEAVNRIVVPPEVPHEDDPPIVQTDNFRRMFRERLKNGLQGLAGLYRLADLHRPGTPDGEILRHAAIDLLLEFVRLWRSGLVKDEIGEARATRFARQLDWLFPDGAPTPNERSRPPKPETQGDRVPDEILADIQGGIVRSYPGVTHGAVLMLAFRNAAAARDLLAWLRGRVTSGVEQRTYPPSKPSCNVALTVAGLRALGMDESNLEVFPEEFRQGMAARAGLLGDVRNNHPRRWRLPHGMADLNPPAPAAGDAGYQRVELDTIHVVVQLRCEVSGVPLEIELFDPAHPLHDAAQKLLEENPGVKLLAAQTLARRDLAALPGAAEDHFGYADGLGQPEVELGPVRNDANRVHLGEIVCGHENAADFEPDPCDPSMPESAKARLRWLTNGSFLVMRKYRQFVHRLESAVNATATEMARVLKEKTPPDYKEIVYAKLMGRGRDGIPVDYPAVTNNFDYRGDPEGRHCPLHAHIRLANPRADRDGAARLPRIMRRGMSYGPRYVPGSGDDGKDRGVLFMAYNASLSEQYEVIQRWLTGGNSTGSSSGQSCPIVGVPENGFPRHFRFEYNSNKKDWLFRIPLEEGTPLFEEPEVLTRLEWGMYLFTPSLSVLEKLRDVATAAAAIAPATTAAWETVRGRQLIAGLERLRIQQGDAAAAEAWKAMIEDPESIDRLDSAALWAVIRDDHGGALKTPYGTLVANRELLAQVLLNSDKRYSICGQMERMKRSIGEIYLGRDAGPLYEKESTPINAAAGKLADTLAGKKYVFNIALKAAQKKINGIIEQAKCQSAKVGDTRFEVGFEAREVIDEVLADLCDDWFGLQGSPHLRRGGMDWGWSEGQPPLYPGHFTALSRYMFQPNPGPLPAELGERYGVALRDAMNKFVADYPAGATPKRPDKTDAPIAFAVFNHPDYGTDRDWVARTMTGVMMGFIAPIIGAVLNVLREWQREGRFAALRAELAGRVDRDSAYDVLHDSMAAAARMRPMPQIVWRTALMPHRLGAGPNGIDIAKDEKIVLGLVSGTQQSLLDGKYDERLMFGGVRKTGAPHPTHACPGYEAAIEAMLGALTGFLACAERMRQGVAPLTFVAEGGPFVVPPSCSAPAYPRGGYAELKVARVSADFELYQNLSKPLPPVPSGTGTVLAVGDSWVRNPYPFGRDLRSYLSRFGYQVPSDFCDYEQFGKIEQVEARISEFCGFIGDQFQNPPFGIKPVAILLSGGGNDSTHEPFLNVLQDNDHNATTRAADPDALRKHVYGTLDPLYRRAIDAIKKKLDDLKVDIPIIVHGYDHSMLRGGPVGVDWFRTPFHAKHYDDAADRQKELGAVSDLIDQFNEMLLNLGNEARYKPFVRYVKLTDTIADYWPTPLDAWRDDLHTWNDPFFVMATKIDAMIKAPYP